MLQHRHLVFVYGTLRRGGSNHFRMAGAEYIASGSIMGRMYRIDWYPGLVLDPSGYEIQGEVYQTDAELLAALDLFEGISSGEVEGSEYRRLETTVVLHDSQVVNAFVWEWHGVIDESRRISSGDWVVDAE